MGKGWWTDRKQVEIARAIEVLVSNLMYVSELRGGFDCSRAFHTQRSA